MRILFILTNRSFDLLSSHHSLQFLMPLTLAHKSVRVFLCKGSDLLSLVVLPEEMRCRSVKIVEVHISEYGEAYLSMTE